MVFSLVKHNSTEKKIMCMDVRKRCECGAHTVQFHLQDNIMVPEVISRLFCRSLAEKKLKIDRQSVVPEFLFDNGYVCWQEMYPGEQVDIKDERQKIIELLDEGRQQYLEAMQSWNIDRIERLKAQGWRKVQRA
jgi:hypothetical protein